MDDDAVAVAASNLELREPDHPCTADEAEEAANRFRAKLRKYQHEFSLLEEQSRQWDESFRSLQDQQSRRFSRRASAASSRLGVLEQQQQQQPQPQQLMAGARVTGQGDWERASEFGEDVYVSPTKSYPNNTEYPQRIAKRVTRKVHVPYTRQVKVPVETTKLVPTQVRKRVPATKLVEVPTTKLVEEEYTTTVQQQAVRKKKVWVQQYVEEPYTKTVPVTRTRQVEVPSTEVQEVETWEDVWVPGTKVVKEQGYRVDTVEDVQVVEVEELQEFDLVPRQTGHAEVLATRELGTSRGLRSSRKLGEEVYSAQDEAVRGLESDDDEADGDVAGEDDNNNDQNNQSGVEAPMQAQPQMQAAGEDPEEGSSGEQQRNGSEPAFTVPMPPPLPQGWEPVFDEEYNRFYFHCAATGVSTWVAPQVAAGDEESVASVAGSVLRVRKHEQQQQQQQQRRQRQLSPGVSTRQAIREDKARYAHSDKGGPEVEIVADERVWDRQARREQDELARVLAEDEEEAQEEEEEKKNSGVEGQREAGLPQQQQQQQQRAQPAPHAHRRTWQSPIEERLWETTHTQGHTQHDTAARTCGCDASSIGEGSGGDADVAGANEWGTAAAAAAAAAMRQPSPYGKHAPIRLGVRVRSVPGEGGCLVYEATRDGAASRAGVRVGDVVTALNQRPTRHWTAFQRAMQTEATRHAVTLEVVRAGRRRVFHISRQL